MAMLSRHMLIRLQALSVRPVSAMSGLDHPVSCTALSALNPVAAGTIPDTVGMSKADNGTFGTD